MSSPLGTSCFPVDFEDRPGCTTSVRAAEGIVAAGVSSLAPLVCPGGDCKGVEGIVSVGRPFVWPTMDFTLMAVWLDRIPLLGESNKQTIPMVTFKAELWIPGFPVVKAGGPTGTDMVVPDVKVRSQVGKAANVIGLTWAIAIEQAAAAMPCKTYKVYELVATQTADLVGWSLSIDMDI